MVTQNRTTTSLRKAIDEGKIDEFLAERENDPPGDERAFNVALASMAGTSSAVPAASPKDGPAD